MDGACPLKSVGFMHIDGLKCMFSPLSCNDSITLKKVLTSVQLATEYLMGMQYAPTPTAACAHPTMANAPTSPRTRRECSHFII
jgi:hypothetical protein